MATRYRIVEDSYYSSIVPTQEPYTEEAPTYATLGAAKVALLEYLQTEQRYWSWAIADVRKLTRRDLEQQECQATGGQS